MTHFIHLETGLEFAGEFYLWCECDVRLGTISLANQFNIDDNDKSVFRGNGVGELMAFLRHHTDPPPANGHRAAGKLEEF